MVDVYYRQTQHTFDNIIIKFMHLLCADPYCFAT